MDAIRLDPAQRAVLELPAGRSAAVLGAPGSGKTTTAVEFIADRVHRLGHGVDQVLVLTARRQQATALRDRLLVRIDRPARGPMARTAASLAYDVARRAAVLAGRPVPTLLSGSAQDAVIRDLLEDTDVPWPEELGADVRGLTAFRTELRDLMLRVVEHGVDAAGLATIAERYGRPAWAAVSRFLTEYFAVLSEVHPDAFDSAELVNLAARAVRDGSAGPAVERLRTVVVDDVQDATESTVSLLAAFAARGVAVVGFGDPDSATDAFRGGEPDLLGRFAERLGTDDVARLTLDRVHRHGPALRGVVQRIDERIGTALAGAQRRAPSVVPDEGGDAVVRIVATTPSRQADAVARVLRERHLLDGVPWNRLAVVVRSGSLAEPLARSLELSAVPTRLNTTGRPLREDPAARALLAVVAVGIGSVPLTSERAEELLGGPFGGVDRLSLRRLRLALRAEELGAGGVRGAGALLVEALERPLLLAGLDAPFARRALRLAETLSLLREGAASRASAEELLWLVWERSRVAEPWYDRATGSGAGAAEAGRDLDGIVALFTAAQRAAERSPDDPAAVFVEATLHADVPDDTLSPRAAAGRVVVTTPVGVQGAEFDTVVVAGVQEGVWPNLRPRGSLLGGAELVRVLTGAGDAVDARRQVLSDELRLFAVAVSRARTRLVVAAVENDEEAASVLVGLATSGGAVTASPAPPLALRPMTGVLRRALTTDRGAASTSSAAVALARLAAAGVPGAHPDDWLGLLPVSTAEPIVDLEHDEATRVRVSPSAVEKFEESPFDWFLDQVAGTESSTSTSVGTMLHTVMEDARTPDEALLLAALEGQWHQLDFDAAWVDRRERALAERMTRAIAAYLRDTATAGTALVGGEQRFTLEVGRATVHGSIDRVERTAEGRIVIVDLKTGAYQVTAAKAVDHAQLGIYQLAFLDGAVEGTAAGDAPGGARLLYVRPKNRKAYTVVDQAALDAERVAAFRARIRAVAEGMAGAQFPGVVDRARGGRTPALGEILPRVAEVTGD